MPLSEIGCNSSDLIELRRKRKQQVESTSKQNLSQENIGDKECEKNANILKEIEETPVGAKLRHNRLTSLITANTEKDINNIKSVKDNILRPLTDAKIDAFAGGTDTSNLPKCTHWGHTLTTGRKIDSTFPPNAPFNMKYEDLLKLEYFDAVINETSRIRPTENEFSKYIESPCEIAGNLWDA
ncbi:hypothetical protein C2G38_2192811 [Gigaspora rosea]|uniref:Uncharacterized protein n=1 Tax=Gigaspora rosea TaxID=44941 RepID=A0A397V5P3_9GLOM|nr:hypothetical protein C2G38_2192811 [Gigaspora rosea]